MLIIFKSGVCADVVMVEKNGKAILGILGRNPDDLRGVLTVEQLPDAIAALKSVIEAGRGQDSGAPNEAENDEAPPDEGVDISLRAVPILALCERSLRGKVPVTWGV